MIDDGERDRHCDRVALQADNTNAVISNKLRGRTVLIVDDNTINREIFARYMSGFGARVLSYEDPEVLLASLRSFAGLSRSSAIRATG